MDPGRRDKFAQFDAFKCAIFLFPTVCTVSVKGLIGGLSVGEDTVSKVVLSKCTTHTVWFERFVRGIEIWAGCKAIPDHSISIEYMNL